MCTGSLVEDGAKSGQQEERAKNKGKGRAPTPQAQPHSVLSHFTLSYRSYLVLLVALRLFQAELFTTCARFRFFCEGALVPSPTVLLRSFNMYLIENQRKEKENSGSGQGSSLLFLHQFYQFEPTVEHVSLWSTFS